MYFKNGKHVSESDIPASAMKKLKCKGVTAPKKGKAPKKPTPEAKKKPSKKEKAPKKPPPKKEKAPKKPKKEKAAPKKKAPKKRSSIVTVPKGDVVTTDGIVRYLLSGWDALPEGVTTFFTDLHKLRDPNGKISYKVRVHSLTVRKSCIDLSPRVIAKEYWIDRIVSDDSLAIKLNEKVVMLSDAKEPELKQVVTNAVTALRTLGSGENDRMIENLEVVRFQDIRTMKAITGINSGKLRNTIMTTLSAIIPPETRLDPLFFMYGKIDKMVAMGHVGQRIKDLNLARDRQLLEEINFANACQHVLFFAMGLRGYLDDDGVVIGDKDPTYTGVQALYIASALISNILSYY